MAIKLITKPAYSTDEIHYALVETAWGYVAFCVREDVLIRLMIPVAKKSSPIKAIRREYPAAERNDKVLLNFQKAVIAYFEGKPVDFDAAVEISWAGAFGRRVLAGCVKIPWGKTLSYGRLAQLAGSGGAGRAVGMIMRRNPTPIVIPCHRVIGADGSLVGYSQGGVEIKKRLLELEKVKR